VWVLVALNAALLSVYALLFPPYTGFDEPQHVDMTLHVLRGETWPWPAPGELPLSRGVGASSNPVYFGPLSKHPYTNDPLPDRGKRLTIGELDRTPAPAVQNYPNQMVQHPPAYYALGALVLKAWPGSVDNMPYDQVVSVLRLLSIVLMTPLPLLIWAAGRRLTEASTAVAAAAMSVGIPGLTRVGANVQNDDLLILATSAMLVGLVRVVTGDLTRRTAVFVGLLTALALFTKGFALVLPVVVVAAYAVHRRAGVKPGLWALVVGGVLGGPWYLMNLVRFGKLQTEGLGAQANREFFGTADGKPHPLSGYVQQVSDSLVRRFWGAIGTTDEPSLPLALAWVLTIAITVLIVLAIRSSRGRRQQLGVLLVPIPLMLLIVVAGSHHWWAINGKLPGVQGRYLYPGLLGLLLVVAMGLASLLRSRRNLAPLLAIGTAFVLQAWALVIILGTYWVPGHDLVAGAKGVFHWSPWPPVVTALPFVAVVVLAPWALLLCARGAFARSGPVIDGELAHSAAA
jgi:4-amino-4-deoxy-L-arabinose transferase-like glycosyltransferase